MTAVTAFVSVLLLAVALDRVGVVRVAMAAVGTARTAVASIHDSSLDELTREQAMRQASLRLFSQFASILGRVAIACIVSIVPVVIADRAGLTTVASVMTFLSRPDVITLATAGMFLGYFVRIRMWPSS